MGWEHRTPEENGGSCPLVQLEQKKSAGAAHGALQVPAGRVRDSRAVLLSKVNSERMRGNSHRLQKRNLLLVIRKKSAVRVVEHLAWAHQAGDLYPERDWTRPEQPAQPLKLALSARHPFQPELCCE